MENVFLFYRIIYANLLKCLQDIFKFYDFCKLVFQFWLYHRYENHKKIRIKKSTRIYWTEKFWHFNLINTFFRKRNNFFKIFKKWKNKYILITKNNLLLKKDLCNKYFFPRIFSFFRNVYMCMLLSHKNGIFYKIEKSFWT